MAGMVDLAAQVEQRMSQLTDAELVGMVEGHPTDYEDWALEIATSELARRGLSSRDVARVLKFFIAVAVVAFPVAFVLASRAA